MLHVRLDSRNQISYVICTLDHALYLIDYGRFLSSLISALMYSVSIIKSILLQFLLVGLMVLMTMHFQPLEKVYQRLSSFNLGYLNIDDFPYRSSPLSEFYCWYTKWKDQENDMDRLLCPSHVALDIFAVSQRHSFAPDNLYSPSASCFF